MGKKCAKVFKIKFKYRLLTFLKNMLKYLNYLTQKGGIMRKVDKELVELIFALVVGLGLVIICMAIIARAL